MDNSNNVSQKNKTSDRNNSLRKGTVLHDRYEIKGILGIGGFGITYVAYDSLLQNEIALKEYFPSGFVGRKEETNEIYAFTDKNQEFFEKGIERFLTEARSVAKFNHNNNVVSVYDFFKENNTAYMVMEYLHGMTLKQYQKTLGGRIPEEYLLRVLESVIYALKSVHENNVVHRDISPDNIFVCEDGVVKLLDFGAAKEDVTGEMKTMSVVLKQGYAPVEQYSRKTEIGPWTDIYALGATLYYCVTGVIPEVSLDRMLQDDLKQPKELNKNISDMLNTIIVKCMRVRAQDRYQSVDEIKIYMDNADETEEITQSEFAATIDMTAARGYNNNFSGYQMSGNMSYQNSSGYSGGQQGNYSGMQQMSGNPQRSYSGMQQMSGNPQRNYSGMQQMQGNPQRSYSGMQQMSGNPQRSYSGMQQMSGNPQRSYSGMQQVPPNPQRSYNGTSQAGYNNMQQRRPGTATPNPYAKTNNSSGMLTKVLIIIAILAVITLIAILGEDTNGKERNEVSSGAAVERNYEVKTYAEENGLYNMGSIFYGNCYYVCTA